MKDKEIREAVSVAKNMHEAYKTVTFKPLKKMLYGSEYCKQAEEVFKSSVSNTFQTLIALAQRYLELGGVVEEATIHNYGLGSTGDFGRKHYNHGRQDTLLAMVGRLEGLEDFILDKQSEFGYDCYSEGSENLLATAIRNHIANVSKKVGGK